ncbi:MAG TPA: caspase family protein [Thermoanaerobaculia bacterium]|nr:caspase family protein [Thermoanaerobaculia bacterium]
MNPAMNAQKKKMALVIGNSVYGDGNDVSGKENALAMAGALETLGFIVSPPVFDANQETLNGALNAFAEQIEDADVVVLFYSGHGVQLDNKNYLIPTDGSVGGETLVLLENALQRLGMAPNEAVKIAFVDACRNNKDLPDGAPKGLANPPLAPPNTLQAYAASPGQFAEGGKPTEKSVYTRAILSHLLEPGLQLGNFFANVRADVSRFSDGQEPFQAGTFPQDFFFRDPVYINARTPGWPHSPLVVILNGEVVLTTNQAAVTDLRLNARENHLVLMVSNGKTYHNGQVWGRTDGWSYKLDLQLPEGQIVTFEDHEEVPFKDGPHHGQTFIVARATIFVHPETAAVTVPLQETGLERRDIQFWALDQEILFQAKLADLQISPDDILGGSIDFSLAPLLKPFLAQFLKTGKFLGTLIADPDKTFVAVRGNKELRPVAQHCMTVGWPNRLRDLRASFESFFKDRNPRPFDVFAEGLDQDIRANAADFGIQRPLEDLRVWTSLDDLSAEGDEAAAPATRAVQFLSAEGLRAMAEDSVLLPGPDEVLFGPSTSEQVVQRVPITARIYPFISLKPVDDRIQIHARVIADLSDLQNKIGALIDTIPLPGDNCSHFGVDNVVARIWGKQITVSGDVATLKLNGDVDVWTCLKNPVPCSRIEWDERQVLGVTIRTPRVVFFDCNPPIKNRNLSQPFEATLPFSVAIVDARTYALKLGDPAIDLGGPLGGVTEGILKIAGVDINAKVKEALESALSPEALKQTLPEFLLTYNPTLTRAEILSNSGALALFLELDALLNAQQLGELIQRLWDQSGS